MNNEINRNEINMYNGNNGQNNVSNYGENRPKSVNSKPSNHTDNGYKEALNQYALAPDVYYQRAKNDNELLYYASRFGDMSFMADLHITNPNIYDYDNEYDYDMCPLTYAFAYDNIELFEFLLSFENINVNFRIDDEPLIHVVLEQNKLNYLNLLSHQNLDLNLENKKGESALYIAVKYFYNNPKEYIHIVEYIIAKTNPKKMNTKSIIEYALKEIKPNDSLLLLLYKYDKTKFPAGTYEHTFMQEVKDRVRATADFRMRAAFKTYVANRHLKEEGPNHEILSYLTNRPMIRPKIRKSQTRKLYNNAASLKVASRNSYYSVMPYLSKTHVTTNKKK